MVQAVKQSGGWGESATDEEIVEAIKLLARTEGIWTEPAGGTTLAVTMKLIASGRIPRDESICVSITGNGLKTVEVVADHLPPPPSIPPKLEAFDEFVRAALAGDSANNGGAVAAGKKMESLAEPAAV